MKSINLFDSSLSGSELGYNLPINSHNYKTNKLNDLSPNLRKKFSL